MLSILSILLFEWNLLIANPAKMTQEASKVAVHRHESLTNRLIEGGMLTQAQRNMEKYEWKYVERKRVAGVKPSLSSI